jgi:hypothetical protein
MWMGNQPIGVFNARVRLYYGVQSCAGNGNCRLPFELGRSNVFGVRVMQ